MRILPGLAVLLFAALPALAGTCPADLNAVDASLTETVARLEAAAKADRAEKCAALGHHIDVMTEAREVFLRCLSGHDRDENAAQMQASIDDFEEMRAGQGCR